MNFLECLVKIFIHFEKIIFQKDIGCYMWYSRNYWDYQMTLATDHFLDQAFGGSNWTVDDSVGLLAF